MDNMQSPEKEMLIEKTEKPILSIWQLLYISFGFLGIQFGFALQKGNASRILQSFGAGVQHLSLFWLAAPLTGMLIQPVIGHYSDRTWTRFGRRRPYFLAGGLLAAVALILLPNSAMLVCLPPLMVGAGMMILMDATFNMTMGPFRALLADQIRPEQSGLGFSIQTFLIGLGAVGGSLLPYLLAEDFGVAKVAPKGHVPDNVVYSFYTGAIILVGSLLYTSLTTPEYATVTDPIDNEKDFVKKQGGLITIFRDLSTIPATMRQLGLVQFFSWFGLCLMWVFMTPAIAGYLYHTDLGDTTSTKFADAGNWVGICFGIYNGVSAVYALVLPAFARLTSKKMAHSVSLTAGGLGLLSVLLVQNPHMLVIPMIGIGLAWGSIMSMPYAILAGSIPPKKVGVYLGLFNLFITLPQIVSGFSGSWIVKNVFDGQAVYALVLGGISMICAAVSVLYVHDESKHEI